jgi:hypothetical protein
MRDLGCLGAVRVPVPDYGLGVRAAKQLGSDLHVPRHLLHVPCSSGILY